MNLNNYRKQNTMNTTTTEPKAWVGCLGCYNNGELNGDWFNADEIEEKFTSDHRCRICNAEEFDCFDTEGLSYHAGHYYSPHEFVKDVRALEDAEANGIPAEAAIGLAEYIGEPLGSLDFQTWERYVGEFDGAEAFGCHLLENDEDYQKLDDRLARYIDVESYATDMLINDFCGIEDGMTLFVWWNT